MKLGTNHPWVKDKWRAPPFSKGKWLQKCENTSTKFLNLLLLNHWANFNQTWQKVSLGKEGFSLFRWKGHTFLHCEITKLQKYIYEIKKSSSELLGQFYNIYNHNFSQMNSLLWSGFSGERCGPWTSCLFKRSRQFVNMYQLVDNLVPSIAYELQVILYGRDISIQFEISNKKLLFT